jgi:cyclic pyranopterin monophosphate synthase
MSGDFTHIDGEGHALMVDVSSKVETERMAVAAGTILISREIYERLVSNTMPKGDVLATARIAGIMATKRTSELIPLCHPLLITRSSIDLSIHESPYYVEAVCTVGLTGKTGVEMEALTGVSVALLTVYDMCKAIDKGMEIGSIHLVKKTGGKSGTWEALNA